MKRTTIMLLGTLVALLISNGSAQARGDGSVRRHQHPVIFDTDADFDDTVALAALAEQHLKGLIDLRAVTITNNGGGLPGKGFQPPHRLSLYADHGHPGRCLVRAHH